MLELKKKGNVFSNFLVSCKYFCLFCLLYCILVVFVVFGIINMLNCWVVLLKFMIKIFFMKIKLLCKYICVLSVEKNDKLNI